MLGLMLIFYIAVTVKIAEVIGKKRYYLFRSCTGREFRRSRYGVWAGKAFASLAAVGLYLLSIKCLLLKAGSAIANLADDETGAPFFIVAYGLAILAWVFYYKLSGIARRAEQKFRHLKFQSYLVPCREKAGKIILNWQDIWRVITEARATMSQAIGSAHDVEVDVVDITKRAELKRIKRVALRRRAASPKFKTAAYRSRYSGPKIVQHANHRSMTVGSLAVETAPTPQIIEKPQPTQADLATVIKLQTEALLREQREVCRAQLESQLAALPEADRILIEELFAEMPCLEEYALSPICRVSLTIVAATATRPRHVQIRGIALWARSTVAHTD